jgi:hypothetical protein
VFELRYFLFYFVVFAGQDAVVAVYVPNHFVQTADVLRNECFLLRLYFPQFLHVIVFPIIFHFPVFLQDLAV